MENNEKSAFNVLVAECACSDKKEDLLSYLKQVIMKVLKKRYEKGKKHPNAGGILGTGTPAEGDMRRAWMILDDFYSDVSKSLLDDPLFDVLDIRTEAIREMQSNLDKNR